MENDEMDIKIHCLTQATRASSSSSSTNNFTITLNQIKRTDYLNNVCIIDNQHGFRMIIFLFFFVKEETA